MKLVVDKKKSGKVDKQYEIKKKKVDMINEKDSFKRMKKTNKYSV